MQTVRSDLSMNPSKACNAAEAAIPLQEFYQLVRMVSRIEARVNQLTVLILLFGLLIFLRLKIDRIRAQEQFGLRPSFLLKILQKLSKELQVASDKVIHLENQLKKNEESVSPTIDGQTTTNDSNDDPVTAMTPKTNGLTAKEDQSV